MATPATEMDQQQKRLAEDIQRLEAEIATVAQAKTSHAEKLAGLEASRPELARRMAQGTAKPDELSTLTNEIAQTQTTISGFDALIDERHAAHARLFGEIRDIKMQAAYEVRLERLETLNAEADQILTTITERLCALIQDDLVAYETLRTKLFREFINPHFQFEASPTNL